MNACPICQGRVNAALKQCSRCQVDLRFLIQIETLSDLGCRRAIQCLVDADLEGARFYANEALKLKRTDFTESLWEFLLNLDAVRV